MAKSALRIEARKLRLNGNSINDICKKVGASKGSVSKWCSDIALTKQQQQHLINKIGVKGAIGRLIASENKRTERRRRMRNYEIIGNKRIGDVSNRDLMIIGTALYWAEGGKTQRKTVFSNSDPAMIALFIKWMEKCFNVSTNRLAARVEINELHSNRTKEIENYWSAISNIPKAQFTKPSIKHCFLKKVFEDNKGYYGVFQITVRRGTNLNYEIMGAIKRLASVVNKFA